MPDANENVSRSRYNGNMTKIDTAFGNRMLSNSLASNYVDVNTAVAVNSSYTAPADGYYILRTEGTGSSYGMWFLDSGRTAPFLGNMNTNATFVGVYLKANTIIYTRNQASTAYRVVGYYPI